MHIQPTHQFKSPYFLLKTAENKLQHSRYGFIVSKRVDTRAVVRNRIKRQYRACIENELSNIKQGYDMLFIVKKESLGSHANEICQAVTAALKKGAML